MTINGTSAVTESSIRIDWVDYAKGICIVMVVMMHSVLGVEAAAGQIGFMHHLVAFAKPFRMPDFFLISGLFLAVVIDRDWRTYLDRKVVHFAYFYVLWVTIQFGFKAPSFAAETGWAHVGLMYLEVFHRTVRYLVVHLFAAGVLRGRQGDTQNAAAGHLDPGGVTGDGAYRHRLDRDRRILCALCLFLFRLLVRRLCVRAVRPRAGASRVAVAGLAAWALINASLVVSGFSEWPLISLMLGLSGAGAIVTMGTLLARAQRLNFLRFCGEHSIVIYLAFFLPMAATRTLLLRTAPIHDIGTISLVVTIVGVVGALALWRTALLAGANFLFDRPAAFWIAPKKTSRVLQAAE